MKNKIKSYTFNVGIISLAVGIALRYIFPEAGGIPESLPHILSGFGAGIMGVGVVFIIRKRSIENNPQKAKEYEINEKDERNIQINEKAGYATWYVTLFTLAVLSLAFLIMDNMTACLLSLSVLLVHKISLMICVSIFKKKL
jgi:uncharacterized membrane protein